MKKLLIATDSFVPRMDGIARFLLQIIPALQREFEITVIAPAFQGEQQDPPGIKVIRIPLHHITFGDWPLPKWKSKVVCKAVDEADVVFSQSIGPIGTIAIDRAHKTDKNAIAYIHSVEWELAARALSHSRIFEWLIYALSKGHIQQVYNKCSLLMVPTTEIGELLKVQGIRTITTVVQMGVDTGLFVPPDAKSAAKERLGFDPKVKIVGYCGRIANEKDLVTLYRAFLMLRKKRSDTLLLIVGDGLESLKRMFKKQDKILVTGKINNVIPYLQAMDVYVLPSLTETSSLSTMEAMACGIPVITTKVGSLKFYIKNKENGLFFPKRNPYILSLKINQLLETESLRKMLGDQARKTITENFQWNKTENMICDILSDF